jgi:hypothetical protein
MMDKYFYCTSYALAKDRWQRKGTD